MQKLTTFAVACAALGTASAVIDALLPAGTVRQAARTATGICALAAIAELLWGLLGGGM